MLKEIDINEPETEEVTPFTIPVKYVNERLFIGNEDIDEFKTLHELKEYIVELAQKSY